MSLSNNKYEPDEGDIIWVSFDPVAGHEQGGHRPAVVLSRKAYNKASGLVHCVPVTTQIKGYPFEVPISTMKKPCCALSDHVTSLDYVARRASHGGKVTPSELDKIRSYIKAISG